LLNILSRFFLLATLFCPVLALAANTSVASDYIQVAGLIDIRTTFSDGELDPEAVVELARERGFEVVVFNDHDRMVMEYGIWPFRNIFKKRVELNSINKGGAGEYLNAIEQAQKKFPKMILIPGSITAPFYYWAGSYFKDNLTAHNHERRLLTVGLDRPGHYESLPILHNGLSLRFAGSYNNHVVGAVIGFFIGLFLLTQRRYLKIAGIVLCLVSILFIIDTNPLRSSPFDQYHGDQGIAPYQLVIDYIESQGGLTFWNYPETQSGVRQMGPIMVNTPPFPQVLKESRGYTGFAALYGDKITITEPGDLWDQVLMEYCDGEREKPVWGIATADFHKEGGAGEKLGNFPTVFLVHEKTKEEVLSAMQEGRMYASRGKYPQRLVLNEFSISPPLSDADATCGERIEVKGAPVVRIAVDSTDACEDDVSVRLIRSGEVIRTFQGPLPIEFEYEDNSFTSGDKIYYRMDAKGCGSLVANPIFVSFSE
jgi:hypothetical protein